jgi:uncharacterized coiled-coil protein SlyX
MKKTIIFLILILGICLFAEENYTDLKKDHWAYGSVIRMTKYGLFKGIVKNGQLTFQGNKSLTRYEFAVAMDRLLNRILNLNSSNKTEDIDLDLSDETFKLQSNLLTEIKNSVANMQVQVNMNKNSINKTIEKVKELEDKFDSSSKKDNNTLLYLSVGSFIISIVSLIFALS